MTNLYSFVVQISLQLKLAVALSFSENYWKSGVYNHLMYLFPQKTIVLSSVFMKSAFLSYFRQYLRLSFFNAL